MRLNRRYKLVLVTLVTAAGIFVLVEIVQLLESQGRYYSNGCGFALVAEEHHTYHFSDVTSSHA